MADLPPPHNAVLAVTLHVTGTQVNGTGTLRPLTEVDGEALTVAGSRVADSLFLTLRTPVPDSFYFRGAYRGSGTNQSIAGRLNGRTFVNVSIAFRQP